MKVSSSMMHVRDLDRSVQFYRDVFSCTTGLRTPDSALLLTPDGFQIYMHAKSAFRPVDAGVTGVLYIMWSTDSEDEFTQIAERMRVHDASASVSTSDGLTLLDGRDPDGIRIVIAYPSPTQFPREVIAARFRG
ncbi:VOC family protein [Rhodococcus sp. AQ5-07]|nr:VOC family protein [Rhodococcus sp. AQ5-07]